MFKQSRAICGPFCIPALCIWDRGEVMALLYTCDADSGLILQSSISAAVQFMLHALSQGPTNSDQMKGMMYAVY